MKILNNLALFACAALMINCAQNNDSKTSYETLSTEGATSISFQKDAGAMPPPVGEFPDVSPGSHPNVKMEINQTDVIVTVETRIHCFKSTRISHQEYSEIEEVLDKSLVKRGSTTVDPTTRPMDVGNDLLTLSNGEDSRTYFLESGDDNRRLYIVNFKNIEEVFMSLYEQINEEQEEQCIVE